jgi:hypothetical protein
LSIQIRIIGGEKVEILATARLEYNDGESIASGWEGLMLIVKFKERGKWFQTKLKDKLVSTYHVHNNPDPFKPYTYDDYFEDCYKYIKDAYFVKREAERMVKEYFTENKHAATTVGKRKDIQNKLKQLDKIEVRVKIN